MGVRIRETLLILRGKLLSKMLSHRFDKCDNLMQELGYSPRLKNTNRVDFQKIKIDKEKNKKKKASTVETFSAHTRERSCFCFPREPFTSDYHIGT